jgi:peptide deformylase
MSETLLATSDPKGVGLAAPQVAVLKRFFLTKPTDKAKIKTFINPEIIENIENRQESKSKLLEGCLSIPNVWGKVSRAKQVTLMYQNEKGKIFQKTFKGFMATIIQHEVDHLNGILFTKHVLEQSNKLYKSYKNESGEDEFEELRV